MSATSAMPASRRLLYLGVAVLIVVQLLVRGYVLVRGGFYWDDVAFIGRAALPLDDLGARFVDYDGHFMPAALLAAAVTTALAPLDWPAAAATILVLQALASVLTARAFIVVAGRRPAVLLPLTFVLFTPLTLTAAAWWASALNALPLQIGLAIAVAETVRYLRGRQRSAVYAVAAFVGALLFFEKALVIPFVAFAVACLLPYLRERPAPVRSVLRRGRALWMVYAVIAASWIALWLSVTASRPGEHTIGFTLRGIWRSVTAVLGPSALGGPWTWVRTNPGPPLVTTSVPLTVVCLLSLAAIAIATWWWAPRAVAAWAGAGAYFLAASATVFFLRSSEYTSPLLPLSLRYFADVAWVLAMAGVLVLTARTVRRAPPRRLWLVAVIAIALSGTVSTLRFAPVWGDNPTPSYLENLRAGAREYAGRQVLDQEVDTDIISRLAGPYNRLSRVLARLSQHPDFADYSAEPTVVDTNGRFVPGKVTRVRSLPLGPYPCGSRVDETAPTTLAYEGPLAYWEWVVQLNYLASDDGVISLRQGRAGDEVSVPVSKGAHSVYVRVSGTGDGLVAQTRTPGMFACVASGPVGLLIPESVPDPVADPVPGRQPR